MALYTIADLHLSITVDKPMDIFGSLWNDHMNKIKKEWEAVVGPDDTVVIPGDISWGMNFAEAREDFLFLEALPGTKLLSKGNHDYWWATKTKQEAFFEENSITSIKPLYNNAYMAENYIICGSRGWYTDDHNSPKDSDYDKIVNREVGRITLSIAAGDAINSDAEKLMFLHFPPVFGDYVCDEIIDCLVHHGISRCYYGHIHGKYDVPPVVEYKGVEFYMVSADYLSFKPLLIN